MFENHRKSLIQPKIPKNGQFGEVLFQFALFSNSSFTTVGAF